MPRPKKRTRREPGAGSFYQRADGMWIGSISKGMGTTATGARRRITVSAKDEATARARLKEKQRQLGEAQIAQVNPRATIKSWSEEWLSIVERKMRPASFNQARSAVGRWIVPTIGHIRFDALAPAHIRAVMAAMRAAGLSSSSQARVHSNLRTMLRAARQEGYPVSEAVLDVEAPALAVSDRKALTVADATRLLTTATLLPHASRWVAAFLQGMRQGECNGLTWEMVDFERDQITLAWQLQPLPYRVARDRTSGFRIPDGYEVRQLEGRWHLVRPKSKAGWRVIPMVPWMRSALEVWRTEAPPSPHGLVWPMLDGGPTQPRTDDEEFYALQCAAGLHHPSGRWYTVHEARHTAVSLLIELGVDHHVIAQIVGQSRLVRSYVHVGGPQIRAALEGLSAMLNPGAREIG